MKQTAMLKFAIAAFIVCAFFLGGCVQVNDPVIKPTDFRSSVRFVDLANTGSSMAVTYDKPPVTAGSATYLNATAYLNLPAGSRFWTFAYGAAQDTFPYALTTNYQYSFYSVYEPSSGATARSYYIVPERNLYTNTVAYPAGKQVVRFINLSTDTAATVSGGLTFHLVYGSTDTTTNALTFGGTQSFTAPASASNSFRIMGAATDTLGNLIDTLVPTTTIGANPGRYSVVFVGSQANSSWQAKVLQEN